MKKVLFTLVLVGAVVFSAQAQLKFGVKGGVNLSSLSGDGDGALKNTTGFFIGPTIEATVPVVGLGVEGSVLYSQKGIKSEGGGETLEEETGYLEVPVSLKYKFALPIVSKLATPFIDAGPYVAFKVSGDEKIAEQMKTKSFGAGLNFGLGVELFSKLQVRGGYSLGLTDNYKAMDNNPTKISLKDRTWQIGASVLF